MNWYSVDSYAAAQFSIAVVIALAIAIPLAIKWDRVQSRREDATGDPNEPNPLDVFGR